MTITRDGKTYELTGEELYAAYREMQDTFDRNDICERLEYRAEDDPGLEPQVLKAEADGSLLKECVEKLNDMIYFYDASRDAALERVVEYILDVTAEEVAE